MTSVSYAKPSELKMFNANNFAFGATPTIMAAKLVPWSLFARLPALPTKSRASITLHSLGMPGEEQPPNSGRV